MNAITITNGGVKLTGGVPQRTDSPDRDGRRKTIAGQILDAHNAPTKSKLLAITVLCSELNYSTSKNYSPSGAKGKKPSRKNDTRGEN